MGLRKSRAGTAAAGVQVRRGGAHPFGVLDGYVPLGGGNARCYHAIREALPLVDAAVAKLVRLTGGFSAACPRNGAAERGLRQFVETVNVGRGQRGLQAFLDRYLDSLLTNGQAVGEIVTRGYRDIAAVLCGNVADVRVREGASPLEFQLCSAEGAEAAPFPRQELLLFTPFMPEAENPYGVSLLRSMPYLAKVLLTIYESMESNFERSGNQRYALTYHPGGDVLDRASAAERVQKIASEWSAAMQSTRGGQVKDFVALGDLDIKTIGADGGFPDTETAVRLLLEQLVSRTGLPPFLLGLSWSSTERMSAQQADVMTSEIWGIRRSLTPVLERVCGLWMAMHGYAEDFEIVWNDVNLQDELDEAKARWYDAQTEQLGKSGEEKKA